MSTEIYDQLTAIPVPTSALFVNDRDVEVNLSARDHARNVKRTISKFFSLDTLAASPSVEVIGVQSATYSPSGKYKAILREAGDDKKKRFVEIWEKDVLKACKEVTDNHGIFYADDFFSSLSFSPSETSIIYVAEKKKITEKNSIEKFAYQQPFGEGLVGKSNPVLFRYNWETDKVVSLVHDAPVWFGQALFGPTEDNNKIFATGYETAADERFLGVRSCPNRPMGIWEISIKESESDDDSEVKCAVQKLTESHLSCRSPRILQSDGKSTLVWLSQATGGAHWATASLHSLDITPSKIDPSQTRTLVDTVWEPAKGEFPGLYNELPRYPFVNWGQGDYIVTSTTWGSRITAILISLKDGKVKELTPGDGEKALGSWSVLSAQGNKVVCSRSSYTTPVDLVLGELGGTGSIEWKTLQKPSISEALQARLDSLTVKVVPIPERFPTETILVQHKSALQEQKVLPMITLPHGGPHGAETVSFSAPNVSLALEGYTLSIPNYTGSTGFGEKYVRALIGQCGTLDVGDCIESVRHLVKIGVATEGHGKLFLSGGSHGGFLLGHLIGQYPDVFTAASLRNPVLSAGEISTSDLEDWYYSEFDIDYPLSSLPRGYTGPSSSPSQSKAKIPPRLMTPEIYTKLYNASPIAHVHKVKNTAVLLLIGDSDLRVAPTQGIGYYHALKALREDDPSNVEMLMFPGESHPLDGLETSKVVWLRTLQWFKSRE